MDGHNHNWWVAWVRLWGAIGAQCYADSATGTYRDSALDLAAFEARRLAVAAYALGTTAAAQEE